MNNLLVCKAVLSIYVCCLYGVAEAQMTEVPPFIPNLHEDVDYWYDGNQKRLLWKSVDEVVIHADKKRESLEENPRRKTHSKNNMIAAAKSLAPEVTIIEANAAWVRVRLDQQSYLSKSVKKEKVTDVYYDLKSSASTPYISTEEMIVHFKLPHTQEQAIQWGKQHNLNFLKYLNLKNVFMYHCGSSENCLKTSNQAYQEENVQYAYPNWMRPKYGHHNDSFIADDTLFSEQWYLDNQGGQGGLIGADINVMNAWSGGHGSHNEIIAIVDDGLDIQHEDLIDNVITGLNWNFVWDDSNPSHDSQGGHGTRVAGIAAARGGNSQGISGVAPHAGLVGLHLLGATTFDKFAAALTYAYEKIDIYNASWGPRDDGHLVGLSPLEELALKDGVENGRGGKGSIYVFAGGNGRLSGDNSNYNGYTNSPYTIAVAASTDQGRQAAYSESGANIWINAPSHDDSPNIMTTVAGGLFSEGQYNSEFGGTSAAAPQVSGVVALMLEQNPELSWRDVQHILAITAYRNDDNDSDWIKNGAGYWVNHKYGFGRVDAAAAATAAVNWDLLTPQKIVEHSAYPNVVIPDNDNTGISSTILIEEDLSIDYIEVKFRSPHSFWGDLEITLISPEGTESILAESDFRYGDEYQNGWRFGVARLLGESSKGSWTLRVKDTSAFVLGNFQDWSIKIYGSQTTSSNLLPKEGLWGNPNRPGHGLDIQMTGNTFFVVWYTFNEAGNPIWYTAVGVLTGNTWDADLSSYHWNGESAILTQVGNISLHFSDATHAKFSWVLGNQSGSEIIEHFNISNHSLTTADYTGTWFEPKRPGYGVSVSTQSNIQTAVLYFYDQTGIPRWVLGSQSGSHDESFVISNYQGYCAYCPVIPITHVNAGTMKLQFSSLHSGFLTVDVELNSPLSGSWSAVKAPIRNLSLINY